MNCGKAIVVGLEKVAEAGVEQDRRLNNLISIKLR